MTELFRKSRASTAIILNGYKINVPEPRAIASKFVKKNNEFQRDVGLFYIHSNNCLMTMVSILDTIINVMEGGHNVCMITNEKDMPTFNHTIRTRFSPGTRVVFESDAPHDSVYRLSIIPEGRNMKSTFEVFSSHRAIPQNRFCMYNMCICDFIVDTMEQYLESMIRYCIPFLGTVDSYLVNVISKPSIVKKLIRTHRNI